MPTYRSAPNYGAYEGGYEPSGGSRIIDLILNGGRIQAEGARRSGDIWASTLGSLGQIATGALQQHSEEQAAAKRSQAVSALFSSPEPPSPQAILQVFGPKEGLDVIKGLNAIHPDAKNQYKDRMEQARDAARGVMALPEDHRAAGYSFARNGLIQSGVFKPEEAPEQYDPNFLTQLASYGQEQKDPKLIPIPEGGLYDATAGKVAVPGTPKAVNLQHVETAEGIRTFDPATGKMGPVIAKGKPTAAAGGALYGETDAKAIADAIMRGEEPPDMVGLGRVTGPAVQSYLAKSGFNLAAAQTDWKATQKHISTLNGPQQTRLNQSINALPDLLDTVDSLASEWKGGKFPALNKANLALAKSGAYGSDVAIVANKLDAQIADVVADLGNVYMGGNSPTDHALSLAGKSLSGDWDEKVLHAMVKMAKGNVIIRRNSIQNTGVQGAGPNNAYAPPPPPQAAAERIAVNPTTGQKVAFRNGAWVPIP